MDQEDTARLSRLPYSTPACPRPLTLDELEEWSRQYHLKRRPWRTTSERGDMDEYLRQFNDTVKEDPTDIEDDEEPPPVPVRQRRQRPLSPPRTPPHLKGSNLYTNQSMKILKPHDSKISKSKTKSRKAPRYPVTRSRDMAGMSLHHRKGYIRLWSLSWIYVVISSEKYLKDYVSATSLFPTQLCSDMVPDREELDKITPKQVDFSYEHPDYPFKTPWQRETCGRAKAHEEVRKYAKEVSYTYKGHT